MPPRTRRAAATKQRQYCFTDDDENEQPVKVPVEPGGVLASLSSNNVPAIKTRKARNPFQRTSPPSSVMIAKGLPCLSPPTRPYCSPSEFGERENKADCSMDDMSAISCDISSPPAAVSSTTKQKYQLNQLTSKNLNEECRSIDNSGSLGSQDTEDESAEQLSDSDDTVEFENDDEDSGREEIRPENGSYESLSEDIEYEPELDDDEYDPAEEESASEEDLDYVEEEEVVQYPKRYTKRGVEDWKLETSSTTMKDGITASVETSAGLDSANEDDETDIETTPAPKSTRKRLSYLSPEPLVAVVVDEDDDSDDDVLVAAIVDNNDLAPRQDTDELMNGDNAAALEFNYEFKSGGSDTTWRAPSEKEVSAGSNGISSTLVPIAPKEFERENERTAENTAELMKQTETLHVRECPQMKGLSTESTLKQKKAFYRQEGIVKRGEWTLGTKIGVGSFGVVHVGMNTRTGTLMAVKIFKVEGAVMKDVRREVELMRSLRHKNIVRYLGAHMDKENLYIFQEWVPGGSIASMLSRFGAFPLQVVKSYLSQTLAGLLYLHNNNIMHRDIKGSNILVNDEGVVKLADFGASKKMANLNSNLLMSLTVRGTPYFMAPEVFEEKYSSKADIWGAGCVAFQMASAVPPWKGQGFTNPISLFNHIQRQGGPPCMPSDIMEKLSRENTKAFQMFKSLLEKCFRKDPSSRPSASDLLQDPFFIEMNEDVDDELSQYPGLFSPGHDTLSSWDASPKKMCQSPDYFNSFHQAVHSSPKCPTQRWNKANRKSTSLSPPRKHLQGEVGNPSLLCQSPHQRMSPKRVCTDWPDWALSRDKAQIQLNTGSKKKQAEQEISDLMESLALSEDSASRNPFGSTVSSKSSIVGSTTNSHLIGLHLVDSNNAK
eukprot:scaffold15305_cov126-Cylindrotheca_fusiformis.AAC.12